MIMDIQKIRTLLGLSADRPLSPEEKRRRIRYIVYPAMCLLFAGSLWLIYSPSEKERAAEEKEKGFNTDIPSPGQQRMDGNKVDAYEREELEKKDKYRKNAFQEMASLFGSSGSPKPKREERIIYRQPAINRANATAMTANRCPVVSLRQYRYIRMSACFHGYFLLLIGRHSLNPCFP